MCETEDVFDVDFIYCLCESSNADTIIPENECMDLFGDFGKSNSRILLFSAHDFVFVGCVTPFLQNAVSRLSLVWILLWIRGKYMGVRRR
jgi:hypothetical protein